MAPTTIPKCPLDEKTLTGLLLLSIDGCCGVFAVELHRAKGYDLIGFADDTGDICHFACRNPEGEIAEGLGKGLSVDFVARNYVHIGGLTIESFTADEIEQQLSDNESLGAMVPPGYREALRQLFASDWWPFWEEVGRSTL